MNLNTTIIYYQSSVLRVVEELEALELAQDFVHWCYKGTHHGRRTVWTLVIVRLKERVPRGGGCCRDGGCGKFFQGSVAERSCPPIGHYSPEVVE